MEQQVQGYTLTLKESDGDSEVIKGEAISLEYVPTDELEQLLPGKNCGKCGCANCRAYAEQLVRGGEDDFTLGEVECITDA